MASSRHTPAQAQFSAGWLHLREPYDLAARAAAATQPDMAAALSRLRAARGGAAWQVLDLGCGLGANLRALAPRLGGIQHWRLVDHDAELLAALPRALARWAQQQGCGFVPGGGCQDAPLCRIDGRDFSLSVESQRLDLARDAQSLAIAPGALLTASALLDLVSAEWLQPLLVRAVRAAAPMWWALNVDGRLQWQPADAHDAEVHALFAGHQQRDKGFDAALGPRAPAVALAELARCGYRCTTARSDWQIDGAGGAPMRRAMLDGIAGAALEQEPAAAERLRAWRERRAAGIADGSLVVGHLDIVAIPG